jgi:hypothetical protein
MTIINRLDKTFGPQLSFSGWILLVTGMVFIVDVMGIVLVILGFILATTIDGVELDPGSRRIRKFSGPFGFPVVGRWEPLDHYAGLTVIPMTIKQVTWSRSNRRNVSEQSDFRIFLVGKDHRPAYAIKKCTTRELAVAEMDKLAEMLEWMVWTTTKTPSGSEQNRRIHKG